MNEYRRSMNREVKEMIIEGRFIEKLWKELPKMKREQEKKISETRRKWLYYIVPSLENVYDQLGDKQKLFVQERYLSGKKRSWEHLAADMYISKRQLIRWRDELIEATKEKTGI